MAVVVAATMAVAVAVLALAATLPSGVVPQFDAGVVSAVAAGRLGWLVAVMTVVTEVGSPVGTCLLTAAVAVPLALRTRSYRPVVVAALALAGIALLDESVKLLVHRARPPADLHAIAAGGYSFPSGHTTLAAAMVPVLVLLVRRAGRRGWALPVLAAVWVLVVGVSRVYLGVHYPSDVLGGWLLGGAWATLVTACVRPTLLS